MRKMSRVFQYSDGLITSLDLAVFNDGSQAEWVGKAWAAEQDHDDQDRALSDHGADNIESYGRMNETVDVWRGPPGKGWLISWWDTDSHVMSIYIWDAPDFALFQSTWICPMAMKIMAADAYIRGNAVRTEAAEDSTAVH